ncbi:MAG: hypothetical protein AAF443_07790 [Chlamydiota bacterium]
MNIELIKYFVNSSRESLVLGAAAGAFMGAESLIFRKIGIERIIKFIDKDYKCAPFKQCFIYIGTPYAIGKMQTFVINLIDKKTRNDQELHKKCYKIATLALEIITVFGCIFYSKHRGYHNMVDAFSVFCILQLYGKSLNNLEKELES